MLVRDILRTKGAQVLTTTPQASLADVIDMMVKHNCGSLVVCEEGKMVGIISERDVLRALATRPSSLEAVSVESRMTRSVITTSPDDSVTDLMGRMSEHRIRHVPVIHDGQLAGLISIGDAVKAQHDQLRLENHYLLSYIQS